MKLIATWKSGHGAYGLRQVVGSVEGTPIGMYLFAQDGTLTLINDYTSDALGVREFRTSHPVDLVLGEAAQSEINPLADRFPSLGTAYLKCMFPDGRVVYF